MADNILKKQLDCISEDFLRGVYAEATKPMWGALRHLFGKVTTGKSTLVRDIARSLRADSSRAEAKRAEEKVSGWLGRWDFSKPVNPWLLKRAEASDDETYAVDFSDISKEFGGEGMEGMAMGWDGSRGVTAMGHDFICVSLVGAKWREARPVYAKLAKGRRSKGELHGEALDAVMEATGGRGWTAEDRGMDSAEHLHGMKSKGRKGVVRVNDMKRDVFGDGLAIDKSLSSVPFRKAHLHTHRGDRRVEIRWKRGTVQHCAEPRKKDAPVENVGVLVVESRFDGKSICLYAVCPDEVYGRQDRTNPLACALYWAREGLSVAEKAEHRRELQQIVYQTLMVETRSDPRFAAAALRELEVAYRDRPHPALEKVIERFRQDHGL